MRYPPNLPPEISSLLGTLAPRIQVALGENLVGVFLRGSLVTGDFDPVTSDVDLLVATARPVSDTEFAALAALHAAMADYLNRYAREVEAAYIDRARLRRFAPGQRHPTLGRGETLAWVEHDANWLLERWMAREQGFALRGPAPHTLIDPITPGELRDAVRQRLPAWDAWSRDMDDPDWRLPRSHKAYVVETMCRALYTLARGALVSKPQAVVWALATLPEPYRATVARSQTWRYDTAPDLSLNEEVQAFVVWAATQGAKG